MIARRKKRRRLADVFAFLFGESRPLFKGAWRRWRARSPPRRRNGETPWRRFFLPSFFFAPVSAKEKAGNRLG